MWSQLFGKVGGSLEPINLRPASTTDAVLKEKKKKKDKIFMDEAKFIA